MTDEPDHRVEFPTAAILTLNVEVGWLTVIVAEAIHPQESVTVTLYEPAAKELMF